MNKAEPPANRGRILSLDTCLNLSLTVLEYEAHTDAFEHEERAVAQRLAK
jgi:hypothetical protein